MTATNNRHDHGRDDRVSNHDAGDLFVRSDAVGIQGASSRRTRRTSADHLKRIPA
jgi:hypothetical protein